MFPAGIGFGEILIIAVVAILLFGRNLPGVARNLGNSYQQFRKGLSDIQANFRYDDFDLNSPPPPSRIAPYKDARDPITPAVNSLPSSPRFDLPPEDETEQSPDVERT